MNTWTEGEPEKQSGWLPTFVQDRSTGPLPMMAEEEGMCQEAAEEGEQNHATPESAIALASLVRAMQGLVLCPPGDVVQPRDIGVPGSSRSSEVGCCPPSRGTAKRRFPQPPKKKSSPLGLKHGNRRCRRRKRRKRRRRTKRGKKRSISPCTLRTIANTQATTSSAQLWEHRRPNLCTFITEK
ncbi:hypothetical protein BTVI_45331 [Pitangus sulphuratus]|nr:hypothetical protein BTVI_45331 [Pitangus sulphuratus]